MSWTSRSAHSATCPSPAAGRRPGEHEALVALGLDPHQRALRPLRDVVAGQVEDALRADDDVLRAVAPLGADPAALHRHGAREGLGDLGLVGHHHDGRAELVAETVDQLEHVVAVLVAELAGRLVGEQQLRAGRDGAGERQPLALPARHGRDDLVGLRLEPDPAEQLAVVHRRTPQRGLHAEPGEADVLPGGGVGQQVAGGALEHRADPARADPREVALAHPADLLVTEEDAAGAGLLDASEQRQEGGLAGPRGAQERDPLAGQDLEVHTPQRDHVVALEGAVEVHHSLAADPDAATGAVPLLAHRLPSRRVRPGSPARVRLRPGGRVGNLSVRIVTKPQPTSARRQSPGPGRHRRRPP